VVDVQNDFADPNGARIGAAVGPWQPVRGGWGRFRSGTLGVEWSLPRLPAVDGMYAAREIRRPDIDFSGIEYVFGPRLFGSRVPVVGKQRQVR